MSTSAIARVSFITALLLAMPAGSATAQTDDAPLEHLYFPAIADSGPVQMPGKVRGVAYSTVVQLPGRPWLRLQFDQASLGRTPIGGEPTLLRITGLLDGGVQLMNGRTLQEWGNTTAYFNGDAVLVEIIADPMAPASRLVMSEVITGNSMSPGEGGVATICFGTDDRVLSAEPANARQLPAGCTAWIFNDFNRTLLTAGHCNPSGTSVIQFNVPISAPDGSLVNPPPQDQYAVDGTSVQRANGGIGNDWCYFGCFPNSVTGKTPFQAQLECYSLAVAAPLLADPAQVIRVTGYGTTSAPVLPAWNQVQKTHLGPYVALVGTALQYQTDTTGGNSGSPVIDELSNLAIGIHTNGGCNESGGTNSGTAVDHPALQNALSNPLGVCIPQAPLVFVLPDGLPTSLDASGDSLRVEVQAGTGGIPAPGTGMVYVDTGRGFVAAPMSQVSPNVYDAIFPAAACGSTVKFYFEAQTIAGGTVLHPLAAPASIFTAPTAKGTAFSFEDDFQNDLGWTVSNGEALSTGAWQRTVPTATGLRVPTADADGSGQCFVTDNVTNNDVDGGSTSLTSPVLDASAPNAMLRYWRWFSTASATGDDTLLVEVSSDGGASWAFVESYSGTTVGWNFKEWPIDQIAGVSPSNQFRVRFTASDIGPGSTVEAGIDGVQIQVWTCVTACPADLNADDTVDGADLGMLLTSWGNAGSADINQDGTVDGADLGMLLTSWGSCPGA